MTHTVHIFALVRIKCTGIEATNHKTATEKAWGFFPELYALFDSGNLKTIPDGTAEVEFAEEISHFLVDEENDPRFEHSTWHNSNGRQIPAVSAA